MELLVIECMTPSSEVLYYFQIFVERGCQIFDVGTDNIFRRRYVIPIGGIVVSSAIQQA